MYQTTNSMIRLIPILAFFLFYTSNTFAQVDSIPSSYKAIEVSFFSTNLSGGIDDLSLALSEDGQEISLAEYASAAGYSVNYTSQKQWKRYPRWSMKIQLGVYSVAGNIRYRRTGASISGSDQIFEADKIINFRSLYLSTGYLFNYKILKSKSYNLSFGPVLAGRIGNHVTGESDIYIKDYTLDPRHSEFQNSVVLDSDEELVGFQAFFKMGLSKQFHISGNYFSIGVEYNRSLLNLHNAGSAKSHMVGVSLAYGFAQPN